MIEFPAYLESVNRNVPFKIVVEIQLKTFFKANSDFKGRWVEFVLMPFVICWVVKQFH
jgi:hypothetical protein